MSDKVAMNVREVAQILGVSHPTVYSEINQGRLRSLKVGRRRLVARQALDDYIAERERESRKGAA